MSPEETVCFKLLDGHAREKHACFLAEFFPKGRGIGFYLCCFRPLGKMEDLADPYACKYVTIDPATMQSIVCNQALPPELKQLLVEELSLLRAKS